MTKTIKYQAKQPKTPKKNLLDLDKEKPDLKNNEIKLFLKEIKGLEKISKKVEKEQKKLETLQTEAKTVPEGKKTLKLANKIKRQLKTLTKWKNSLITILWAQTEQFEIREDDGTLTTLKQLQQESIDQLQERIRENINELKKIT